ncbi:G5 domain-containing protein [Bacillus sp. BRMEA1]|uniref:G5 domain-containing protein n=1 Tax=Neobacillus endophyticus TaxID=2738405 RepID=UPI0015646535|nr:G5 domain-containing protein [Neobacillus endophyticus]NRD76006.1 G5 domain-containing protein [Neobacillus endophyticus]
MRKIPQSLKLFIVLILCTAYVYSFSHLGVKAYSLFHSNATVFPAGTSVATISIAGETKDEAVKQINAKISDWIKNSKIVLRYNNKSIPVDTESFVFNAKATLDHVNNGQNNPVSTSINESSFTKTLNSFQSNVTFSQINKQKLMNQLVSLAADLHPGVYELRLEEYFSNSAKSAALVDVKINPANAPEDLPTAVGILKSIDVKGQSTFSLLSFAEQKKMQDFSSDSLSIIASGIYQAILQTNFTILERNTSQAVPEYTSPGFEAKVDLQKNDDFVFANPNHNSYQIELEWLSDGMHITLFGQKFANTYKIDARNIQYFSPKTIVQYSPILNQGQINVQVAGKKGLLVKVYRKEYQNGLLVHNELISEDFYPPVPRVEIHPLVETGTSSNLSSPDQVSNGESGANTSNSVTESSNEQSTNQANSGESSTQEPSNKSGTKQPPVTSTK